MRYPKSSWTLILAAIGLLTPNLTSNAHAFQQTMTCNAEGIYRCKAGEKPQPVQWPTLELTYHINSAGSKEIPNRPDGTIGPELEETIHQSFRTWMEPECSELSFQFEGFTDESNVGYADNSSSTPNVNMVIWRDEIWPYGSFSAVALTTVTFRPSTGQIVDADIELNGATYLFSDNDNPQGAEVDIRNTLTHEVGHFLGLDHTTDPTATMYPTAPPLELTKRDLSQDDIDGLCYIYPLDFKTGPLKPAEPEVKKSSWGCATTTLPDHNQTPSKAPHITLTILAGITLWTRRHTKNKRKPQ